MQPSCITLFAMSIVVFLTCHFTTVYGKCSGRWAIHACYGGNGKRSGPPVTDSRTDSINTDKLSLLERILLEPYALPDLTDNMSASQSELVDDAEEIPSLYPDLEDDYDRERELKKTQAVLASFLLKNRFRTHSADDLPFRRR